MDSLKEFCLSLPNAVEDYPFGPTPLVIKVENKMFAIVNSDNEISLKCDPFTALDYRDIFKAVKPGYHLNKKHWNTVEIGLDVDENLLKDMIIHSYECIVKTLPKKKKENYLNLLNSFKNTVLKK